ncbi:hypothetical protein BpHYR1_006796 [Brachionus plicatilis]|uniref:Uncharacterized protein n=1 Tax=Brachionus plicatilis TaxID=10195 RepID=A0A3M7S9M5_BRAPC|nr:hypothetical protein BpHYR1_006796 [Brachionus plicatilis]
MHDLFRMVSFRGLPDLEFWKVFVHMKKNSLNFDIISINFKSIKIKLTLLQIDSLNVAYFNIDLLITKLFINLE